MAKNVTEQAVDKLIELSAEDQARALELLSREKVHKEKVAKGEIKGYTGRPWSELSEDQKEKSKAATRKRNAKIAVLAAKAVAAGMEASEEEIQEYIAKTSKK